MSRVHELLNQIIKWVQQYNSEEWHKVNLDPGLTLEQIQNYYAEQPFILPTEILELYQWRNGTI
jgi:cell wall assembly regulator SMI1